MKTVLSLPTIYRLPLLPRKLSFGTLRRLPTATFGQAVAVLREWRRRSGDRAALAGLDERMLRDIGLNRGDVLHEINKPFWRR